MQIVGEDALARAEAAVFHSGAVRVVDGDERRLAAHREAHVVLHRSASIAWPSASIAFHCSSV